MGPGPQPRCKNRVVWNHCLHLGLAPELQKRASHPARGLRPNRTFFRCSLWSSALSRSRSRLSRPRRLLCRRSGAAPPLSAAPAPNPAGGDPPPRHPLVREHPGRPLRPSGRPPLLRAPSRLQLAHPPPRQQFAVRARPSAAQAAAHLASSSRAQMPTKFLLRRLLPHLLS